MGQGKGCWKLGRLVGNCGNCGRDSGTAGNHRELPRTAESLSIEGIAGELPGNCRGIAGARQPGTTARLQQVYGKNCEGAWNHKSECRALPGDAGNCSKSTASLLAEERSAGNCREPGQGKTAPGAAGKRGKTTAVFTLFKHQGAGPTFSASPVAAAASPVGVRVRVCHRGALYMPVNERGAGPTSSAFFAASLASTVRERRVFTPFNERGAVPTSSASPRILSIHCRGKGVFCQDFARKSKARQDCLQKMAKPTCRQATKPKRIAENCRTFVGHDRSCSKSLASLTAEGIAGICREMLGTARAARIAGNFWPDPRKSETPPKCTKQVLVHWATTPHSTHDTPRNWSEKRSLWRSPQAMVWRAISIWRPGADLAGILRTLPSDGQSSMMSLAH